MRATAPSIQDSTADERLAFVRQKYVCIADCDQCGICASFHGKDPEHALAPYIEGSVEYVECLMRARH